MKKEKVTMISDSFWNAVNMVSNYRYARKINDKTFIKVFESAYPKQTRDFFNSLAEGNYKIKGDVVEVEF